MPGGGAALLPSGTTLSIETAEFPDSAGEAVIARGSRRRRADLALVLVGPEADAETRLASGRVPGTIGARPREADPLLTLV